MRGRVATTIVCVVTALAGSIILAVAIWDLAGDHPDTSAFGPGTSVVVSSQDTPWGAVSRRPTGSADPRFSPAPPMRIQIPALRVDAAVSSVATVNGQLAVPEDPLIVGWWAGSALPGSSAGAVVVDGHVDSATRGLGTFFRLSTLRAADIVTVTTVGGGHVQFQVTARRSYSKAAGLPADLFARSGPARLVLITCGGQFDAPSLSYRDNVVIFAKPTVLAPFSAGPKAQWSARSPLG